MPNTTTSYVCTLTRQQANQLKDILIEKEWQMDTIPYALWRGKKDKICVVAYESGKTTVQGKGTAEFVQFILEPEILKELRFGYENELKQIENPDMFLPHAGIDESGKGDYFGPLVIACAFTDEKSAKALLDAGVADSKTIKSEAKIKQLDELIRKECANKFAVITIGPQTYNKMYASFGTLNRLLAWGHAKALEELLTKVPDCRRAISDQFASTEDTVKRALMERGRQITLEQHPKAEADVAVAAASILARAQFVKYLEKLSEKAGCVLPKGGGAQVKAMATQIAARGGMESLSEIAKLHFCITEEALNEAMRNS